jgi:aspartate-semialdehyde dehydrogenase
MNKIKVGILGATGSVGQKFVSLLANHPWFEIAEVAASGQSAGKRYSEACRWIQKTAIPENVGCLEVKECKPGMDCQIVFSGLDASVAGEIEGQFAQAGYGVFSNARNYRLEEDVPIIIPEVNDNHIQLLEIQKEKRKWPGFIITNPNCSTVFLAMVLHPLHKRFKVEKVSVVTMQAVSGAGYPGVPSLDILGNVLPFIPGEEEKIEKETQKILGTFKQGKIENADIALSVQCNRVAVEDGHIECVSIKLKKDATEREIKESLQNFKSSPQLLKLPSAPEQPIILTGDPFHPQPKYDVMQAEGMAAIVGRLRKCPVLDYRMVILGHNTIRGAAGASILNAELLIKRGLLNKFVSV